MYQGLPWCSDGQESACNGGDLGWIPESGMDMSLSKLRKIVRTAEPGVLQFMGSQRVGHHLATEQVLNL